MRCNLCGQPSKRRVACANCDRWMGRQFMRGTSTNSIAMLMGLQVLEVEDSLRRLLNGETLWDPES